MQAGTRLAVFTRAREGPPSQLAAHAYCYKHLELAAYDLLARVALHAQDAETARVARRIGEEEQAIADRLADLFDTTVDAALAQPSDKDLQSDLLERMAAAHATEEESVALLRRARDTVARGQLRHIFEDHLAQSEIHRRLLGDCLQARGAKDSAIKHAAVRLGPLGWGLCLQAQPITPAKLAACVFAFEHLEIPSYRQLVRVAGIAGDQYTLGVSQCILIDEQTAAAALKRGFDAAVVASLEGQAVSSGAADFLSTR
jgi:ferritin-like metal-binding protein YciE